MKNKDYEKTTLAPVIIPLCGFICAAALTLFIIFAAAYFGAFDSRAEEAEVTNNVQFKEPKDVMPRYPERDITPDWEDLNVRIDSGYFNLKDGALTYGVKLTVPTYVSAHALPRIELVKCTFYKDAHHISDIILSSDTAIAQSGVLNMSGAVDDPDPEINKAVVYVSWTEADGTPQTATKLFSVVSN